MWQSLVPSSLLPIPVVALQGLQVRRYHVLQHRLQWALQGTFKSLLLVLSALSLLLALLLHCQRFFLCDLQAVKDEFQI